MIIVVYRKVWLYADCANIRTAILLYKTITRSKRTLNLNFLGECDVKCLHESTCTLPVLCKK
jgi:hypothetical protein